MRRAKIVEVLKDSIPRHFDDDVVKVFDLDDLDNIAKMIQEDDRHDSEAAIASMIEYVADNTDDKTLDWLADGECDSPNGWLYSQVRNFQ